MNRDMSYDLDAAFAGRNAGELVSAQQTRTVVRRMPGVEIETPSDDPESLDAREVEVLRDADAVTASAQAGAGPYPKAEDMAGLGMEISLPLIGRLNLVHVAAGVAVGALLMVVLGRMRRTTATNPRRRCRSC